MARGLASLLINSHVTNQQLLRKDALGNTFQTSPSLVLRTASGYGAALAGNSVAKRDLASIYAICQGKSKIPNGPVSAVSIINIYSRKASKWWRMTPTEAKVAEAFQLQKSNKPLKKMVSCRCMR